MCTVMLTNNVSIQSIVIMNIFGFIGRKCFIIFVKSLGIFIDSSLFIFTFWQRYIDQMQRICFCRWKLLQDGWTWKNQTKTRHENQKWLVEVRALPAYTMLKYVRRCYGKIPCSNWMIYTVSENRRKVSVTRAQGWWGQLRIKPEEEGRRSRGESSVYKGLKDMAEWHNWCRVQL